MAVHLQGMAAALLVLAAVVAVLGPTITLLPLTALRLVIGALLAIFGLQWLRKAILRATGYKALHDEASAYLREVAAAKAAPGGADGASTTGTPSPSRSRACCWRASRSCSS